MKPIIQYFIKAGQRARSASNKGFSLMEMIVSIAVMTVLLGSLTPQVIVYINKANKAADVLTAATIYNAFVTLMADHSKYTLPPRARSIYDEEINSKDKPYRTTFLNAFYGSGNSNNNLIYKVRTVYDNKLEEYYYCCITRTEYLDGDAMRFSTSRWKTRYNHGKYYLQFNDPGGVLSRFISQEVNQFLSTTRLEVKCMHPEDETRIKTLRIDNLWNVYLTNGTHRDFKNAKTYRPYINRYVIGYRVDYDPSTNKVTNRYPEQIEIWAAPECEPAPSYKAQNYSAPIYRLWPNPDDVYTSGIDIDYSKVEGWS